MSNRNIIDRLRSIEKAEDLKLTSTTKYTEFTIPGLVEVLHICYTSDNPTNRMAGTFLNAMFTQQQPIVITVRDQYIKLVNKDKNITDTMNWRSYNKCMAFLQHELEWITMLREPKKGKGGLYKLSENCLVGYMERLMGQTRMQAKIEEGVFNYDKDIFKGSVDPDMEGFEPDPELQKMLSTARKKRGSNG